MWLTSVTVWLFCREGVAKSPCRCGSVSEIYMLVILWQWNVFCGIMTAISTNFVPGRSMMRTVCLMCAWMNT